MADDGQITFSTALDNSSLEKGLKETEREIDALKKKIEEKSTERNALAEQLKEAAAAADETGAEVDKLKIRLEELQAMKPTENLTAGMLQGRIEAVSEELAAQTKNYNSQIDAAHEIAQEFMTADNELKTLNADLSAAETRQRQLGTSLKDAYTQGTQALEGSFKQLDKSFTGVANKVQKRLKKLFMFSFIFSALSTFKGYLVSTISANEEFAASLEYLKAVMRGFAAPIVAALTPVFVGFIRIVTAMFMTLAKLIDTIFRTNLVGSINDAIAAARASTAAAAATDKQAKATNRLAKAQKEAAKWLAAFDELNVMQAQDNSDNADAIDNDLGGLMADEAAPAINWDAFDVGKIDTALAEIMILLGAALMAVGAILCFSGINIPLGITLMAIGALMVYTAVSEKWDELPDKMKAEIVTLLEIIGGALIVIGVILCLTGNIPLGVGFIIAGAVIFATAVALDWENIRNNVGGALNALGLIIGAAIAIIGVVLIVTGHVPLGIAAIILGIAIFAVSAATIDKNEMPDRVQVLVDEILDILGGALVALGAILCATGHIPLGIAAIIAGIFILGVREGVITDKTVKKVKKFLDEIVQEIKDKVVYVFAIGLILLATGHPVIGIAAILVGIYALVSTGAIDWEFLLKKVKEVWDGIVKWFNETVAPIFTVEWWKEKFKSIVNGLISILNDGIDAGDWFAWEILSGLQNIASNVGIDLGFQYVPSQHIPYLAQGAVIPPNRRFMAVLGDQTNGANLEAPESLIRQIVREETGGANAEMISLMRQMVELMQGGQTLECDGYTLAKVVNQRNAVNARLLGAV